MLRYLHQGIQKALRNNQARAPCQKTPQDNEEYELPQLTQLRRRIFHVAPEAPLSQPLTECETQTKDVSAQDLLKFRHHQQSNQKQKFDTNDRWTFAADLVKGAVLGTGFAVFHGLHGFCSGRRKGAQSDRSKFCPISQYQRLQRSSALLHTISHMLPGSYDTSPGFSVLPNSDHRSLKCAKASSPAVQDVSDAVNDAEGDESAQALQLKEYQKAKTKVDKLLDSLCQTDADFLAADHMRALQAWAGKDFGTAAGLWEKTLDKIGTAMAANRLGYCYEHGHGVTRNYQQAARYYKISAEHNCGLAMYNLAMLQLRGLVEEEMDTDSYELMNKAASLNCTQALTYLGSYHFKTDRKEMAVKYYERAAKDNDAEACYFLGICYENGYGTLPNDTKALELYRIAAEQGHPEAQYNLAVFLEDGLGGATPDRESSIYWYKESANHGIKSAIDRLLQMGECVNGVKASHSMPAFQKHLIASLSDLSLSDLIRSHSDNRLTKTKTIGDRTAVPSSTEKSSASLTPASSCSSLASGAPKFFLPAVESFDSDTTFSDWCSEDDVSTTGSPNADLNPLPDVTADLMAPKFNHSFTKLNRMSLNSCSQSSLYKPEHDSPQILFTA